MKNLYATVSLLSAALLTSCQPHPQVNDCAYDIADWLVDTGRMDVHTEMILCKEGLCRQEGHLWSRYFPLEPDPLLLMFQDWNQDDRLTPRTDYLLAGAGRGSNLSIMDIMSPHKGIPQQVQRQVCGLARANRSTGPALPVSNTLNNPF